MLKRQSTQNGLELFRTNEVLFDLNSVQPLLEAPQTHALDGTRPRHDPVAVNKTLSRLRRSVQTLPFTHRRHRKIMTEVQTRVEVNIALAQNAQGAKVLLGLDAQDVIEHSKSAGVGFWKVTEMFVERGGSPLKIV